MSTEASVSQQEADLTVPEDQASVTSSIPDISALGSDPESETQEEKEDNKNIEDDEESKPNKAPKTKQLPKTASGQKPCSICHTPRNVLIRCQYDATGQWGFICTGKCWRSVSGGKVDGGQGFPHYRYGGMWKNKRAEGPMSSGKIKGAPKEEQWKGFSGSRQARPIKKSRKGVMKDGIERRAGEDREVADEER